MAVQRSFSDGVKSDKVAHANSLLYSSCNVNGPPALVSHEHIGLGYSPFQAGTNCSERVHKTVSSELF